MTREPNDYEYPDCDFSYEELQCSGGACSVTLPTLEEDYDYVEKEPISMAGATHSTSLRLRGQISNRTIRTSLFGALLREEQQDSLDASATEGWCSVVTYERRLTKIQHRKPSARILRADKH